MYHLFPFFLSFFVFVLFFTIDIMMLPHQSFLWLLDVEEVFHFHVCNCHIIDDMYLEWNCCHSGYTCIFSLAKMAFSFWRFISFYWKSRLYKRRRDKERDLLSTGHIGQSLTDSKLPPCLPKKLGHSILCWLLRPYAENWIRGGAAGTESSADVGCCY